MAFLAINYGRGAQKRPITSGCETGPRDIQKIFSHIPCTNISPTWEFDLEQLTQHETRMAENLAMMRLIYKAVLEHTSPAYLLLGGDHSINFAHFKAVADKHDSDDIALVYIDAHFDCHTPASSLREASGSPHGMNVRALTGEGHPDFLAMGQRRAPLKKENLFYLGPRSYEKAEIEFVRDNKIYYKNSNELLRDGEKIVAEVVERLAGRKYFLSVDCDALDPHIMPSVQVPERGGLDLELTQFLIKSLCSKNTIAAELVEYSPHQRAQYYMQGQIAVTKMIKTFQAGLDIFS